MSAPRLHSDTGKSSRDFLDYLIGQMPVPVQAIQVDGGSEFMAEFELGCRDQGIRLFTLPPRSLKLNGCVGRLSRTYRQEFYEHCDGALDLPTLGAALADFEQACNTQRPHQALGYLTPLWPSRLANCLLRPERVHELYTSVCL